VPKAEALPINSDIDAKIVKGKLLELDDLLSLGIEVVKTRKEVKNTSLVRNFVSSYEDRYVTILPLKGHLNYVSFKLCTPTQDPKAFLKNALESTKNAVNKQVRDYS